eukprot:GHVH01014797.1.p1 GENE.GHVH01014797.1~~GHVH01014797.1.p1  ORF type:complete len:195 (+),score=32.44 GHVH01014797.1:141-725(+)
MAEGLKSLKQKLVKDENTVTTLDSIGWYYKVGTFSIELEIVANGIKDTKQRYVTVTTADQIFVSSCHEHKNRYTAESIKGVLYDKCFPKMLNVIFYDEKHLLNSTATNKGFTGSVDIPNGFDQDSINIGVKEEVQIPLTLRNVSDSHDKVHCNIRMKYNHHNSPVAHDHDVTSKFLEAMDQASSLYDSRHGSRD